MQTNITKFRCKNSNGSVRFKSVSDDINKKVGFRNMHLKLKTLEKILPKVG